MFNKIRNTSAATRFLLWTAVMAGMIIPLQTAEPSKHCMQNY